MTIEFSSVSMRNFMSYGNNTSTVQLDVPGTTLITGENLDGSSESKGANGVGKAQPLYSKIKIPGGWTTMGDIRVGDLVTTPCGDVADVTGVFFQGARPVYRITLGDGRSVDADINHLWNIKDGSNSGCSSIVTTGDLIDLMVYEQVHLPLCNDTVGDVGCSYDLPTNPGDAGDMLCNMTDAIALPSVFLNASSLCKLQLLNECCGFAQDGREYNCTVGNLQLARDVSDMVFSIGGSATITVNGDGRRFDVSMSYPLSRSIIVDNVEYIGDLPTQCISINHPDHLYTTDNYIVTHNTSIINAITYALYDKPISDISKDNLVNNINQKNMEVSINFRVDGISYVVKRTRKSKDGAGVFLHINGEDKTPGSVTSTNAEIERIVGMPYDLFVRIVVFSASHVPFLSLPSRHATQANQSDFIEELFGLTVLSRKAEILKDTIKETEGVVEAEKLKISMVEREHERHNGLIDACKRRVIAWEGSHDDLVAELQSKLTLAKSLDIAGQKKLFEQISSKQRDVQDLKNEAKDVAATSLQASGRIKSLVSDLSHLVDGECPFCLQLYADSVARRGEIEAELTPLDQKLRLLDTRQLELTDMISNSSKDILVFQQSLQVDTPDALIELGAGISGMEQRLVGAQHEVNPFIEPLDELLGVKLPEADFKAINEYGMLVDHQKFLLKLLTKKDSFVRKELLDRNVPYLNLRLQHYLRVIGLPHKVEFRPDMSVAISQFGHVLDFGNLSAGQRARVNVSLSLAFRDVLQQLHQHINICLFDEVLDIGLDAAGVHAVANLLKLVAKESNTSMYIISHKSEFDGMFDNTLTIQLSGGFSNIKIA